MRHLFHRLLQPLHPKKIISRQQALEFFFLNPTQCFTGFNYDDLCYLPEFAGLISMSDIYVRYAGYKFGYIQDINIDAENKKLFIGHLATEIDYQGIGIARAMVYAMVEFIRQDVDIDEVHFCERSEKVEIYSKFFEKLGATSSRDKFNREKWVWKIPMNQHTKYFRNT